MNTPEELQAKIAELEAQLAEAKDENASLHARFKSDATRQHLSAVPPKATSNDVPPGYAQWSGARLLRWARQQQG